MENLQGLVRLIGGNGQDHAHAHVEGVEHIPLGDVAGLLQQGDQAGDLLIGLASSGVHSNGFSLVRRVFDVEKPGVLDRYCPDLGKTLGEALLAPTKIYVKPVLSLLAQLPVRSIAHITGGGFYENIPRALPEGKRAVIQKTQPPALFQMIQQEGGISEHDMYNTFNMGVGMLLVVPQADADKALDILREAGEDVCVLGHVEDGERGVTLC